MQRRRAGSKTCERVRHGQQSEHSNHASPARQLPFSAIVPTLAPCFVTLRPRAAWKRPQNGRRGRLLRRHPRPAGRGRRGRRQRPNLRPYRPHQGWRRGLRRSMEARPRFPILQDRSREGCSPPPTTSRTTTPTTTAPSEQPESSKLQPRTQSQPPTQPQPCTTPPP